MLFVNRSDITVFGGIVDVDSGAAPVYIPGEGVSNVTMGVSGTCIPEVTLTFRDQVGN